MVITEKLFHLVGEKRKNHLILLVAFSIVISIVETIGVSAIMPFIDVSTNFSRIHDNTYYEQIFVFFGFESEASFSIVFGLFLFGFYIFRAVLNLAYIYATANFEQSFYGEVTRRMFKAFLSMPYQEFTNKNSSYLTKAIITDAEQASTVVGSIILMISEIFVIIFIYILMLAVNWQVTVIFSIVLSIKLLFLTKVVSRKMELIGVKRAMVQADFYEMVNRLFGNFKHIKLQHRDIISGLNKEFSKVIKGYTKSNIIHSLFNAIPRMFIETGGFSIIIIFLVLLLYLGHKEIDYILPTLSLFVLSLYRLLPSVNRIMDGYNTLMYHSKSIDIVYEQFKSPQENFQNDTVRFKNKIELLNVEFSFQKNNIIKSSNLTIYKGDKVAFIGKSGAGKSTLADIIVGLLRPDRGEILVDSVVLGNNNIQNWRSQIGYISQQTYLFDGTILDNICFGRPLNEELLTRVLNQVNLFTFLETKQGVETLVGEGGVQLSGGQKQRISIARALYGQPEILVLDEATSSLDEETEEKIMKEIYLLSKNKTLIIIAHRLSTIKECKYIYEIKDGVVCG